MRMIDLIEKKKSGQALTEQELRFMIDGYLDETIPDYQMSAMLMAIRLCGMNNAETVSLTDIMAHSGDMLDLSILGNKTVDKHSTGGVGDKTTLIVAPIAAALGCAVAKMSGRGLGHTGGTIDKLEAIPGFCTALTEQAFLKQVQDIGLAVVGTTGTLAPADKKLYALRDVTGTVDSIPLIASSIMSKKLAAGSNSIVLDVKVGSGAFMKTKDEGEKLAHTMVSIGKSCGRQVSAVLTNMDIPLGQNIGNMLEVTEAIDVLRGNGAKDLRDVSIALASHMVMLAYHLTREESEQRVIKSMQDGSALTKFREWITAQGGEPQFIDHPETMAAAPFKHEVKSTFNGYITHMDTEQIGNAAMLLGAGRATKTDSIDPSAGITLYRKTGDHVTVGEPLAVLFASDEALFSEAEKRFTSALQFGTEAPKHQPLILGEITE